MKTHLLDADVHGGAVLALLQQLANAVRHLDAGVQRDPALLRQQLVRLAEDGAPL